MEWPAYFAGAAVTREAAAVSTAVTESCVRIVDAAVHKAKMVGYCSSKRKRDVIEV